MPSPVSLTVLAALTGLSNSEDLRAQFRTFGEGLQMLNDKVDQNIKENRREHQQIIERIDHLSVENRQEHQLFMQMVKELDTEVIKMKRVK